MAAVGLLVLIGAVVLAGTALARRIHVSEALVLLLAGAALSFVPGLGAIELPPEAVLLLILPALVYWESLNSSLRELRANLRVILLAAVGLVLLTALGVGATAHAFGLPWAMALALGAIVAPTDATAIAGIASSLPRRQSTMLRGESLVNDGTSLALYGVAVGAAVSGHAIGVPLFTIEFVASALGAVAVGLAIGFAVLWLRRFITERLLASTLSILTPLLAFLPAELLHASGVVAAVTCGLVVAHGGSRVIAAPARRQVYGFWQVTSFVLNGALFVLTGLQLHRIVDGLDASSWALVAGLSGAAIVVVIGMRLLWFNTTPYVLRAVDRRAVQRTRRVSARHRFPLAWAGMRGSVSLAAALALPLATSAGAPLPHRELLVDVTFAVILFTVVVQGLTLPAVLRWARLPEDARQAYEVALATRTMFEVGLAALPDAAERLGTPAEVRDRLAAEYRLELDQFEDAMDDESMTVTEVERAAADEARALRRAVIPLKREALLRLRREGRIDDDVVRRVEARLDVEEIRLIEVIDDD